MPTLKGLESCLTHNDIAFTDRAGLQDVLVYKTVYKNENGFDFGV